MIVFIELLSWAGISPTTNHPLVFAQISVRSMMMIYVLHMNTRHNDGGRGRQWTKDSVMKIILINLPYKTECPVPSSSSTKLTRTNISSTLLYFWRRTMTNDVTDIFLFVLIGMFLLLLFPCPIHFNRWGYLQAKKCVPNSMQILICCTEISSRGRVGSIDFWDCTTRTSSVVTTRVVTIWCVVG